MNLFFFFYLITVKNRQLMVLFHYLKPATFVNRKCKIVMGINIQNTRQIISGFLMVALSTAIFTACSKDDDATAKANMKFTITVNGADSNDQVDFLVSAGNHDASQYGSPVWKMNGANPGE
jgi:hypothetical protein